MSSFFHAKHHLKRITAGITAVDAAIAPPSPLETAAASPAEEDQIL